MPGSERVILFVDRLPRDLRVTIVSGERIARIEPTWLAVTLRSSPTRKDAYVLYYLSESGEVLALDPCDLLDDVYGKALSLARVHRDRWRSCDVLLPDDWSRIPRTLVQAGH